MFNHKTCWPKCGAQAAYLSVALLAASAVATTAEAKTTAPAKLAQKGTITYCSDISFPPFEFYDAKTNEPAGFDIDLGIALAAEMGLKAEYKNIGFDGLIPALQAGQCDAILSGLFDKPARREVINLVDYANVGNSLIVRADSNLHVESLTELSGKTVAVEAGSTLEQEIVEANKKITDAGKPPMKITALPKASDAFQQLMTGLVEAYFTSTAQEAYFNAQNPGQVKIASPQTSTFLTGIGVPKADGELTSAFDAALKAILANGEYDKVIKKWNFEAMSYKPGQ
ncbi:ABC transporter substrate-binding protein [Dongia soli]|uniref:ABC transporter substrate-binding protein n=1 Tax=Dongia soli TaxID=600628 RepID=A0ABU5EEB3_9PROT|nr:ABC transporter substrate-binding protein [Dongia soli]MDY0884404.1 ABC transporter substrate-binding protein [Dongia soli]